jgi:hypothetical protein
VLKVDGLVCGKFVDAQMFNHFVELVFVGISAQETANLLDFTSQILGGKKLLSINTQQKNCIIK